MLNNKLVPASPVRVYTFTSEANPFDDDNDDNWKDEQRSGRNSTDTAWLR
jgi:hypothetical protein